MKAALTALCLLLLITMPVNASVIYDNGLPEYSSYVFFSEEGYPRRADAFVLQTGASTISDIHWWGSYFQADAPVAGDAFTISIYSDDSGLPDETTKIWTQSVSDAHRTFAGSQTWYGGQDDVYEYWVQIAPVYLEPEVTYHLSITNMTADDDNSGTWNWDSSGPGKHSASGEEWPGWWTNSPGDDLAFYLTGHVIPEPATMILFSLGLLGLAGVSRRKKLTK